MADYNPYQGQYQNPYPGGAPQPKSTFLKVMGILLIIFGAIGLIGDLAMIGTYAYLGLPMGVLILSIIDVIIELVAGIIGVTSANDANKAGRCVVLGLLLIIVIIIVFIAEAASGYFSLLSLVGMGYVVVMSIIFSLIMPVLYLLAAILFARKK